MTESNKPKKTVNLIITTPRGLKFERTAELVIMRSINGDVGVMSGHERMVVALGDGTLRIVNGEKVEKLALFGGVATIDNNELNIYSTLIQSADEIDRDRLMQDKEDIEAKIEEAEEESLQSMKTALKQALLRMEVISHYDDDDYDFDSEDYH